MGKIKDVFEKIKDGIKEFGEMLGTDNLTFGDIAGFYDGEFEKSNKRVAEMEAKENNQENNHKETDRNKYRNKYRTTPTPNLQPIENVTRKGKDKGKNKKEEKGMGD